MKKLITALMLLLTLTTQAYAQSYQHPDWTDGTVPVRNWSVPSSSPTGAAPADTYEPSNVSDTGFTESQWIITTDGTVDYVQGSVRERKVRITCEPSTAKQQDPILYYNINPPIGHRHQGIGNVGWTPTSTWTSLRADPSSTCSGGPLNGTIYWEPEMLKQLPAGVIAGIRPQTISFYYIGKTQGTPNDHTWLRRNFGFILGANFGTTGQANDYNDTARRLEYANAGYQYPGSPDTPAGFAGWQCYTDAGATNLVTVSRTASRLKSPAGLSYTGFARHLKAEDGSDPWGGACQPVAGQSGTLLLNLVAPGCWDRHNLRSPTGRDHVAYAAGKADSSVLDACPKMTVNGVTAEYGHVPQLTVKSEFRHTGFSDYGNWYFSSDRMNAPGTPADTSSKDPCRAISAYFCPGSTAHADWIGGWKSDIMDEWERECLGIPVRGVAPVNGPAECGTSQISKFRKMVYTGVSPDPAMSGGCSSVNSCTNATPGSSQRYNPLAAGTPVPGPVGHKMHN